NGQTTDGQTGPITTDDSAIAVWVVPTNEEVMIARDTACFVGRG
ncbi:MAG: acetate kinase, partial [Phycisphaerae bacterium]|nr:acetate kinase [Phycisphaerae bacterium]